MVIVHTLGGCLPEGNHNGPFALSSLVDASRVTHRAVGTPRSASALGWWLDDPSDSQPLTWQMVVGYGFPEIT